MKEYFERTVEYTRTITRYALFGALLTTPSLIYAEDRAPPAPASDDKDAIVVEAEVDTGIDAKVKVRVPGCSLIVD